MSAGSLAVLRGRRARVQIAPGITIGGKYTVEQPLARGGMGAVWVARHVKLGSAVAIKFLDAHLAAAPALVARFEREARAAANLDTPHVVKVHDYGVEDGTPYLVMELLRGEDLNMRIRRVRRLGLPAAAKILSQMGRALRRAHEAGIVHRDLKPANVFLARVEDEDMVKILDFGIAKETWSRVDDTTKTGEVFGSPHYMSPEQARAQKSVDHRADVWATGVIVYRMITGRLPFPGEALGEVMSSMLVDPFPPIREVAPELPAALEGFFSKALAKKKEERFSSIGELVDAFAVIAASEASGSAERAGGPETPTSPTLEAADSLVLPAGGGGSAGAAAAARADASSTVDTTAPTRPFARVAVASVAGAAAAIEKTSPSIGTTSSTLFPGELRPRRTRAVWVILGAAASAVVVGALLFLGASGPDGPAAAASAGASATGSAGGSAGAGRGAETALSAEPAGTPPAAAPTASAAANVGSRAPGDRAGPSGEPAATTKAAGRPTSATTGVNGASGASGATSKGASSSGVPGKSPPPKKQNPDWGL